MITSTHGSARPLTGATRDRPGGEVRLAGALSVIVGTAFLFGTMLAASIAPGYDFHAAAISDLGVIDETALLFGAVLVAIGALDVVAGVLLYRRHGQMLILVPTLLGGLGAVGAGLVPLDRGALHSLFALAAFVGFNVQALTTASAVSGPLRALSIVAGVAGLIAVVVMVVGDAGDPEVFGAIGHGGAERLIAYPVMTWLVALGGALLADDRVLRSGGR